MKAFGNMNMKRMALASSQHEKYFESTVQLMDYSFILYRDFIHNFL